MRHLVSNPELRAGGGGRIVRVYNSKTNTNIQEHSWDDGKSAFSVRGVVMQSVSSLEGLSREMATPVLSANTPLVRSNTTLSKKVSILSRQDGMSRCGGFKSEHSVSTECYG